MQPTASTHPGLWADRYLRLQTTSDREDAARDARRRLINEIVEHDGQPRRVPDGYERAFRRWAGELEQQRPRTATASGQTLSRVLVGTGQKGPAEFGITLHHTWGVPVLPGSSLKGIAAAAAARHFTVEWRGRPDPARVRPGGPNAYDALFGDVEEAAAVIFHDALLDPRGDPRLGLYRDVITVHHPEYYQRKGDYVETEEPNPVGLVSAYGSFFFALELNPALDPAEHGHWLRCAWKALQLALQQTGVGAKANAGYGRIDLKDPD